ncbi:MAG: NADH-quinone oxidoreductase subunit M [Actinobacteria bacterium]|nr:NADH-quinone oxidoreductase subunit M [Actinomycetota bacterium]
MEGFPILTAIIFLPVLGIALVMALPKERHAAIRWTALAVALLDLALGAALVALFKTGAMNFIERFDWIASAGISYHLGLDGISMPLFVLALLLSVVAVVASWSITERVRSYFALLLLLEVGMLGVFAALDFVLFYVFWELVLIPMFFLIGIWGSARREYAAIKFFIYTLLGSVLMLVGIISLYFAAGIGSFDILKLQGVVLAREVQIVIFAAFFLGFAVKVPIFPFHTWLPDAHVEAPTAGSVLLAGVLLKMGGYGFIRIALPILPKAFHYYRPAIAGLAIVSIIYGAALALAQKDLKKLIAYSSVSHMGYVMLGIAAAATASLNGAVLQMVSHGLITGMLFLLVGYIYERTHTRQIAELGGLSTAVPKLAGLFGFAALASLGLPGMSGFVAEFLVVLGSYKAYIWLSILAASAVVLTAGYLLWTVQRVNFESLPAKFKGLPDASLREIASVAPLATATLAIGLYPLPLLAAINPAVGGIMKMVGG